MKTTGSPWALITGVGRGNMAAGIALELNRNGFRTVLLGYDAGQVRAVARELEQNHQYAPVQAACDFATLRCTGEHTFKALVDGLRQEVDEITAVVHAAGLAAVGSFLETEEALFDKTFAVNLKAPFFLTQEILRSGWMRRGVIVNISSTVGESTHGWAGGMAYSMSKSSLTHWSQMMARELAPEIRVNTVLPGSIDTPMADELLGNEGKKAMAASIPLKRLGTSAEVASVVMELLNNPYLSGTEIRVDGARTVGSG